MPSRFDAFGAVFRVPVRSGCGGLRFVVHRGRRGPARRPAPRPHRGAGGVAAVRQPGARTPGSEVPGPELDPARALAVFIDRTTIALPPEFAALAGGFALVATAGGGLRRDGDELVGEHTTLPLTTRPGGLFQAQSRRFPHLRAYRAFSVRELGDAALGHLLRGQLMVVGRDAEGRVAAITGVQLPGLLDDLYAEAADAPLGVLVDQERPTLAVWAPTARSVSLELSRAPGDEPKLLPMDRDSVTGVRLGRAARTDEQLWLGCEFLRSGGRFLRTLRLFVDESDRDVEPQRLS